MQWHWQDAASSAHLLPLQGWQLGLGEGSGEGDGGVEGGKAVGGSDGIGGADVGGRVLDRRRVKVHPFRLMQINLHLKKNEPILFILVRLPLT